MKKIILTILCLVFAAAAYASLSPALLKAHKASHQIMQSAFLLGRAGCTATAIGPQALLTATHCELPSDVLYVRGYEKAATIVGRVRDGQDHTIYLLTGIKFDDYIDVNLTDPKEQGEDVYVWGNPGQWSDQFRKGYITGYAETSSPLAALFGASTPPIIFFDIRGWHGDSGSAVLNEAGQIISVVSVGASQSTDDPADTVHFMGGFALGFTQQDIDEARKFTSSQANKGRT